MEKNQFRSIKRWLAVMFGWVIAFVFLALLLRMFLAVMVAAILLLVLAAWAMWPEFHASWIAGRKRPTETAVAPEIRRRR